MSDHDVLRAQQTLRRHGVPLIGDVRLISKGRHGVEVHVEVNGVWRLAIKEHHDCTGCTISHYVSCDGAKPLDWPEATLEEPPEPEPPTTLPPRRPEPLEAIRTDVLDRVGPEQASLW